MNKLVMYLAGVAGMDKEADISHYLPLYGGYIHGAIKPKDKNRGVLSFLSEGLGGNIGGAAGMLAGLIPTAFNKSTGATPPKIAIPMAILGLLGAVAGTRLGSAAGRALVPAPKEK